MKWLVFFLSFPLFLIAQVTQQELSYAPLLPLTPQYPLDLTEENRRHLIEDPERIEASKQEILALVRRHTFPWLEITGLIALAALGWVAFLTKEQWLTWRKKTTPPLSPKQQAEKALQSLAEQRYLEKEMFTEYYTELAAVLLGALERQLGWKTKERTTEELEWGLKGETSLPQGQKAEIVQILAGIDQVKFAQHTPTLDEAREMHHKIEKCVGGLV